MRYELNEPSIRKRLLELRGQGLSFEDIGKRIQEEFEFPFKVNKITVWRAFNRTVKDMQISGDTSEFLAATEGLSKQREEEFFEYKKQLTEINKILWSHLYNLEEIQSVLNGELKKWVEELRDSEKVDNKLLMMIQSTLSTNVATISTISSQIIKQLELQTKMISMLTKPVDIKVNRLDVIAQINTSMKQVNELGYNLTKPCNPERKFNLTFKNNTAEEILKKLKDIGAILEY